MNTTTTTKKTYPLPGICQWERLFPASLINTVCVSTGGAVTAPRQGVIAILRRNANGPKAHWSAEVMSADATSDEGEYAEIGLSVERGSLVDYDGVACLPREVVTLLREAGVRVSADFID